MATIKYVNDIQSSIGLINIYSVVAYINAQYFPYPYCNAKSVQLRKLFNLLPIHTHASIIII